jgi:hypothetical protein
MTRLTIAALLTSAGVAGCAHSGGASPAPSTATLAGTEQCLFASQVRNWQTLDDSTLLVEAPTGGNVYLFKLFGPVAGLQFQESLAFIDGNHDGRLCSMGDSLAVGRPTPQEVPIIAVRLLTREEAAALRKPLAGAAKQPKSSSP